MKIAALGEDALTRRIARWSGTASRAGRPFVALGIGDDAALLAPAPGARLAVTADALNEGVHFRFDWISPRELGMRAAAQNLSDLAAMAAAPRAALLSLTLPAETEVAALRAFYAGFRRVADPLGCAVAGGNLARGERWSVAVTAIGEVRPGRETRRSGARPGDELWVTGTLGDAAARLALLLADRESPPGTRALRRKFAAPLPRVRTALLLAEAGLARAAIDVSDGLSSDLARLCAASGVGAEVEAASLPLSPALRRARAFSEEEKRRFALHGGEEWELLLAVPPGRLTERLRARIARSGCAPLARIGTFTRRRGVRLLEEGGRRRPLRPEGWDHFRAPAR